MRKKLSWAIACALSLWAGSHAHAEGVALTGIGRMAVAPSAVSVLRDDSAALTFEQVTTDEWSQRFQPRAARHLNFGATQAAIWLRFTLLNLSPADQWVLLVDNPRLERVDLFAIAENGFHEHQVSGEQMPLALRPTATRELAFPLQLPSGSGLQIYLRLVTSETLYAPLVLLPPSRFWAESRVNSLLLGIAFGAGILMAALALWNLAQHRSWAFGGFAALAVAQLAFSAMQEGAAAEFLLTAHPEWIGPTRRMVFFLLGFLFTLYTLHVLDAKSYAPRLRRAFIGLAAGSVALLLSNPALPKDTAVRAAHFWSTVLAVSWLLFLPYLAHRGNRAALRYLLSFSPIAAAVFIFQARNFGLPVSTELGSTVLKLGSVLFLASQFIFLRGQTRRARRSIADHRRALAVADQAPSPIGIPQARGLDGKPVRVLALGRIEVWRDDALVVFGSRGISRPQLLLAALLAACEAGLPKSHVTELLWPDADGDQAEQSFRTALHRLRGAIGADAVNFHEGRVRLDSARVWDDGSHFAALAGQWLQHLRGAAPADALAQARDVLDLYQGDFLPPIELPSVCVRRDHLRGQFMALVLRVGDSYAALGRHHDALELYRMSEARGAMNVALFEAYIRCQSTLGLGVEALRTYTRCKAWLEEAGIDASPQIERLRSQLPRPADRRAPPDARFRFPVARR